MTPKKGATRESTATRPAKPTRCYCGAPAVPGSALCIVHKPARNP